MAEQDNKDVEDVTQCILTPNGTETTADLHVDSSPSGTESDPLVVGDASNPAARRVRIVHISDTHLAHDKYLPNIPNGDILIHSGDFDFAKWSRFYLKPYDYYREVSEINAFMSRLPHKYKVFVAGNHELNFSQYDVKKTQSLLTECLYLQDSSVTLEGLSIYGTPWTGIRHGSKATGFTVPYPDLGSFWSLIPDDVDILVTHQPPIHLLDLGKMPTDQDKVYFCEVCMTSHCGLFHVGCKFLREEVFERIRPMAHCFGHVHEANGVLVKNDILFSNAAMIIDPYFKVIDVYVDAAKGDKVTELKPVNFRETTTPYCSVQ